MNRESTNASEAGGEGGPRLLAERAEALIRSLKGVHDVRVELAGRRVCTVHVVPAPGAAARGITRNVQSALMAALGLTVDPRLILVVTELAHSAASHANGNGANGNGVPDNGANGNGTRDNGGNGTGARDNSASATGARDNGANTSRAQGNGTNGKHALHVPAPLPASAPPVAPIPEPEPDTLSGHRRLAAAGLIGMPVSGTPRAEPRIEVLELNRLCADQLQCRVVIELAGRRRTGIAEAADGREGAVTLAARATLEALRVIEFGAWIFEGAADVIISGQRHVCVSVKQHEAGAPLSGAAPVHESVEYAVVIAVLNAAGFSGALHEPNRRMVHHR